MDNNKKNKISVLGSLNKDIFLFVKNAPEIGETISARNIKTGSGGKGANQAAAIGKLKCEVDFVGQVGDDEHGKNVLNELKSYGVDVEKSKIIKDIPTGQAYILSYPNKDNSIIIVGGANMSWENNELSSLKQSLQNSKYLLLQREIPEEINIAACKLGREANVKIILDMGGEDKPISNELLNLVDIISPNKTEFKRLLQKEINIENHEEILKALNDLRSSSDNKTLSLLLKLGHKGCLYVDSNDKIFTQSTYQFPDLPIKDTTGAGDCFTGAFVTQIIKNDNIQKCLKYATLSAYLCITKFGAMPSMPYKEEVDELEKKTN